MSEVRDVLQERQWLRFLFMMLGMVVSAIGINGFLRPAHLLSGGATGISTSLNYLTNIIVNISNKYTNFYFGIYLSRKRVLYNKYDKYDYIFSTTWIDTRYKSIYTYK